MPHGLARLDLDYPVINGETDLVPLAQVPLLALQLTMARRFIERQGGKFLIEKKSPEIVAISFSLPSVKG